MGGNLLDFTCNIITPTASVTTAKCVFNSVVSTPGARCILDDIKNYIFNNILPEPEFMCIPLKIIPQEIIDAYNLTEIVNNQGWIYMRIKKGMHGLKQAWITANQELVIHKSPFGYQPVHHTSGLCFHDSRKTILVLWSTIYVLNIV